MATESQPITTRIVSKGQIDVPDNYSEELGLEPGAEVTLIRIGNGLLVVPESETLARLSNSVRAAMQSAELAEEDMLDGLQKSRDEIHEKLYGNKESGRGSNLIYKAGSRSQILSCPTMIDSSKKQRRR